MLTVSNYHYARPDFSAAYPSIFGKTPAEFAEHLSYLATTGRFITPEDFRRYSDEVLDAAENYILITFDDGLREQYEHALPVLEDRGIEALFFVNSINHTDRKVSLVHQIHLLRSVMDPMALLDRLMAFAPFALTDAMREESLAFYRFDTPESALSKYMLNVLMDVDAQQRFVTPLFESHFNRDDVLRSLYMDLGQVQDLCARKMIGSHTHSHYPLGLYDGATIATELKKTQEFLLRQGAAHVDYVAYPYGTPVAATPDVAAQAQATGHRFGFTTAPASNRGDADRWRLSRFDCNDLTPEKYAIHDNKRSERI